MSPLKVFERKTAIWPRVTLLPGQYMPGLQPPVTPSLASCSIQLAKSSVVGTSVKIPTGGGGTKLEPCSARRRKTAIASRVTFWVGQYFPPPHPVVMPSAASCSIQGAKGVPVVTSVNLVPVAGGGE